MKRKTSLILALLLLLAGVSVITYPMLSDYINRINGSQVIQELNERIDRTKRETLEEARAEAEAYNRRITGMELGEESPDEYENILDFGNGAMGYLQIPKISVNLPIYHGVSDSVLSKGVGHLPQSALPIGGVGNHTVLSGHTGLPRAELFNDLTELEAGDVFYIHILGEILAYEVDQIKVVLPSEVDDITAVPGEDYCTLVTCTPYGINSHRLLVRGVRTERDEEEVQQLREESQGPNAVPLMLTAAAATLVLILAVVLLFRRKRK